MKRSYLFLGLLLGVLSLAAQPAFSGGAGGGYDRASLQIGSNSLMESRQLEVRIFPNPVRVGEVLQVKLAEVPRADTYLQLIGLQAQLLAEIQLPLGNLSHTFSFPKLPPGHYVLLIRQGNLRFSQPLILLPQ